MSTLATSAGAAAAAFLLTTLPLAAGAAPPSPLETTLFAFPGAVDHPPSGASAGLALADRWLGAEPFGNPAAPWTSRVTLSPALVRVSRQDLRADNRNYDETPAFFDAAGGALGLALPSRLGPLQEPALWIYASQPVLRLENNAYTRGRNALDPSNPPAVIESRTTSRETRGGVALSSGVGPVRLGGALEWTRRDDEYEAVEVSGSPESGTRVVSFSGDGVGAAFGARWDRSKWFSLGAALRRIPSLTLEGDQRLDLFSGDSAATIAAARGASWEGGVTARVLASEGFALLITMGGRSEQRWEGLDAVSGSVFSAALGMDYRVPEAPWTLRFGVGQEQQKDVPEPRATSVGVGFGWDLSGTIIDVGAVRRGFQRGDRPTSYDDRVVASVRVDF